MALAIIFAMVMFWVVLGAPLPAGITMEACGWMLLSGLVGYVIGDYCLFQCYIIIGSRYGQLFMTLAPLAAALMAWITLGQEMNGMSILAMIVTLAGISISVLGRGEHHKVSLKLPLNGVLFAIAAALCQGIGLVLSKIGMDHYVLFAIAAALCQGIGLVLSKIGMDHYDTTATPAWVIPFSANFLRCIAGIIGFGILLYLREGLSPLREALHDHKGMAVATATTIFGPFVGVGFSLMAVQYTEAGIASTLMALTPIIIILPSYWLFQQKITWKAVVGAFISVIGVSLFFLG